MFLRLNVKYWIFIYPLFLLLIQGKDLAFQTHTAEFQSKWIACSRANQRWKCPDLSIQSRNGPRNPSWLWLLFPLPLEVDYLCSRCVIKNKLWQKQLSKESLCNSMCWPQSDPIDILMMWVWIFRIKTSEIIPT